MNESSFLPYLAAGALALVFALVVLSLLRRRARGPMLVNNASRPGGPPVLSPPARRSVLELGRELAPELEGLLGRGDRAAAVRLVRERAGLGAQDAEHVVEMFEKVLQRL